MRGPTTRPVARSGEIFLLLVVKAKLEAVRAGISTLEDVNAAGRCSYPTDLEPHRLALWRPDVRP